MLKKHVFVKQDEMMDCGVCSLLMIIRSYGGDCSKEYLRNLTNTTKEGTTAYDLLKAGERFSFTTFGLKGDIKNLPSTYLPVIAHVVKDGYYHFVVIYEIDFDHNELVIADSASSISKMELEKFLTISTEQFLVFIPSGKVPKLSFQRPLKNLFFQFTKEHFGVLLGLISLSFLYTIGSIFSSFYIQVLLETVYVRYQISWLVMIALLFFVVANLKNLAQFFRFVLFSSVLTKLDLFLFQYVYHHLFSLPYSYYENHTTGEISSKISDLSFVKSTFGNLFFSLMIDLFLVIFSFFLLLYLQPMLTCLVLSLVLFLFLLRHWFRKSFLFSIRERKDAYTKFSSQLVDVLSHIPSIRHVRCEEKVEGDILFSYQDFLKKNHQYQKLYQKEVFFQNLVRAILDILVVAISFFLIDQKMFTFSNFMTYFFLLSFFLDPISHFLLFLLDYFDSLESIGRIQELIEVDEEEIPDEVAVGKIQRIELRGVTFSYHGRNLVFSDKSIEVSLKDKILLYGSTGCGKSTFSKILAGLENRFEGEFLLNGEKFHQGSQALLRKRVLYVGQNDGLLHRSIKENILLGREVSEQEFLRICHICRVDEIVARHILTYDMMVDEDGANLSGGERQRVILARSILTSADIYIFDESLCNIDISLEREILIDLFSYLAEKAVIVVSHRFYNADLYPKQMDFMKGEVLCESYLTTN